MNKLVKTLKHLLIPHKHNDFKPHILREASVICIALVAIILFSTSIGTSLYIDNKNMTAAVLPAVLIDFTNKAREAENTPLLALNSTLEQAAKLKAEDMASNQYFAHTSPVGLTPWYWFKKAGYTFIYAGENLAINFTESEDVSKAWMNSPTHKANILDGKFTEIGIATSEGMYKGYPTIFVVQMFGTPAIKEVAKENTLASVAQIEHEEKISLDKKIEQEEIKVETITETEEFIAVKNTEVMGENIDSSAPVDKYSTWYERFLFKGPGYINTLYSIFIWVVLVSLLLMIFIEIRTQHKKNIIYGVLLLIILLGLLYVNKTFFTTYFVA